MPSATFSAGKLLFVYYDFRDDLRLQFSDLFVTDPITSIPTGWHTVDVRAAEADPADRPVFTSVPVSKYLFGVGTSGVPQRLQANPVNYPMFAQGTVPFMGDYIDVTAPAFVQDDHGRWRFNTEASNSATFTTAWTDNRDVKPPAKPEDWTKYTPPEALAGTQSLVDPHKTLDACSPPQAGMRNENIYSARITQGFAASSPGNTKPLGKIQRAFVVYVENSGKHPRSYRLTIANQPSDGQASFLQFELRTTLDLAVGPRSTIARTVFVTSANSNNSTTVNVTEIASIGGFPVVGGFQGNVVLNPDILNPDILNPDILNPDILNPDIRDSEVSAPNISVTALNPDILNPDILNPDILNPDILNPDILNPDILNPDILNPDILNPDILNPDILNPDILNPDILNTDPDVQNADRSRLQVNDLSWTTKNNGNTTSAFSFKTSFPAPPPGFKFQLMVYRVSSTPATSHCALVNQPHEQLVVNVLNPDILNPDILNPDILNPDIRNTTFFIAPGESAKVQFRVFDLDKFDGNVIKIVPRPSHTSGDMSNNVFGDVEIGGQPLNASMVSLAVDTADAQAGITQPTAATTRLTIITTMLASGRVGIPLSNGQLKASGGSGSLTWNLVSGDLPPELALSSSGLISGTPTTAGAFTFTVRVVDAIQQVATRELTLGIAPPLGIAALVFVAQPAPCTSVLSGTVNCVRQNVPISPTVTVRALGPDGVPVPNIPIGISIGGSEGATTPGGANTAVTNASGVAAFSTLTISEAGLFTLVASAPNFSSATTAPFNVIPGIQIATTSLSDGVRLSPYTGLLLATGGVGTKTWTVTDGILPPGLSLGLNTGQIAGIPTTSGIFIFTVRVTDSGFPQQSDSRSLSIRIAEPLAILDSVLPDANLGTNYTQQVNASGGIAPLTWQVAPGSVLPPGLSFSSAGVLFGTPTTAGDFNFSVRVSDSSVPAQVATRALSLAVRFSIFVASFDSEPLGPLATEPNTNPLPLSRPTVIIRDEGGIVDVVAPTLGFTTRSMLLDGTPGNLANASFFNPVQFFSGQAVIQWRSSIAAIPPSDASGRIGVFVEANDDNVLKDVWTITYEPSGILTIGGIPGPNISIGGYTPGIPTQFRLVLDLDKRTYTLSVNGALAASGNLDAQLGFNHTVFDNINRFSEANYPALAVDDVNISVTSLQDIF